MGWDDVVARIRNTLVDLTALLNDVKIDAGDFVASDAYFLLMGSLNSRSIALSQLQKMSPPILDVEIEVLKQASEKYKILLHKAVYALSELNSYIYLHKGPPLA